MIELTQYFANKSNYKKIIRDISPQSVQLVTGISESARASLMAVIAENKNKPVVIFTANAHQANLLYSDLRVLYHSKDIYIYNVNDMIHTQTSTASPEERAERIETLEFLVSKKPGIIIIPIAGARRLLPPKNVYQDAHIKIDLESEVELDSLVQRLVSNGYRREQIIAKPGEFSVRGGIIDIYPLTKKYPIRIELFDIEVDSIRSFSVDTQRSHEQLTEVIIPPATENILPKEKWAEATQRLKFAYEKTNIKLEAEEDKQRLAKNLAPIIESLEQNEWHENFGYYSSFIFENTSSIIDYISEEAIVLYDEYPRILENHQKLEEEETLWLEGQANQFNILENQKFSHNFIENQRHIVQPRIYFSILQRGMGNIRFTSIHSFHYREMQNFFGQLPMIKAETESWQKRGYDLIVMTENEERAKQVQEMFSESDIKTEIIDSQTPISSVVIQILPFTFQKGFELIEEKVVVLTEKDMFNRKNKRRHRQLNISNAERIKSYNELDVGDYVVHLNHGIGKYMGMETLEIKGVHQDYLVIEYKNSDRVLIPVTQLNLIQKYVSAEGKAPKIHKLGGTTWAKTKNRVRKQVEDIADELIELYAERESQRGYAFSPNDDMYREFEEAFPYIETPDQLRSIKEINEDMEKEKSMDRLVVGDVGFGKTEVAMRATFKAIQDGKQVAFLVPTTVLAQQHYETFTERFVDFPVKVEMLSRFRTQKQSDDILNELAKGQVDILIGTHRILSQDVKFQDLGLLVVDEEQRFGVKHKERLKQLKKNVDVLTLTATPIPRTLHMSLVGARDLSVIETPPSNRYPVQTYVVGMDGLIIREAIEREMARGGQTFFLHNRVQTIESRVREIEELVPHARVTYIHGRLSERELETILYDFLQGEYDVLVTTTIIETGIDMPNVNTLLVENADHMGLSQLYQLRGRIGRSNRVAYAYFMYEPMKLLNEESQKRLQAIKDFTELGSGFKIAMRDLSIRGAGNLLGQQQHGFIDSVGFDLYSQMLEEAVAIKQGKAQPKKTVVEIDLDVDAYIPASYVGDERQKIELYKRIRLLSGKEEYHNLQDEFIDRFGDYPQEVADLLEIGLIKYYGEQVLLEKIKQTRAQVELTFSVAGTNNVPIQELFRALEGIPLKVDVQPDQQLSLVFAIKPDTESYEWLQYILKFVENLFAYYEENNITDEETDAKADIPLTDYIADESKETGA